MLSLKHKKQMSKHGLCLTRLKIAQLTLCIQAPSYSPYKSDPPCPVARTPAENQKRASKTQENAYVFLNTHHIKQFKERVLTGAFEDEM